MRISRVFRLGFLAPVGRAAAGGIELRAQFTLAFVGPWRLSAYNTQAPYAILTLTAARCFLDGLAAPRMLFDAFFHGLHSRQARAHVRGHSPINVNTCDVSAPQRLQSSQRTTRRPSSSARRGKKYSSPNPRPARGRGHCAAGLGSGVRRLCAGVLPRPELAPNISYCVLIA